MEDTDAVVLQLGQEEEMRRVDPALEAKADLGDVVRLVSRASNVRGIWVDKVGQVLRIRHGIEGFCRAIRQLLFANDTMG